MTQVTYRFQAEQSVVGSMEGRVPHPDESVVIAGQAYQISHIYHVPGSDQAVVELNQLSGRDIDHLDLPLQEGGQDE